MNMTAQIESTGEGGRIHLSEATATLLLKANKGKWICKREDMIRTKGKGAIQTYWLDGRKCMRRSSMMDACSSIGDFTVASFENEMWRSARSGLGADKTSRLIEWNCDVLQRLLKQIIARRVFYDDRKSSESLNDSCNSDESMPKGMPLEEVAEIIALPAFDHKVASQQKNADSIELPPIVLEQLKEYVTTIAYMYPPNPFHNFAHASHVVKSVMKHMNRIIAPSNVVDVGNDQKNSKAAALHDHTYGITSDPLTQFACVFSALIHDVDHPGVPNARLVEEDREIAAVYNNRSVAEQNSLDLSWKLLMEDRFRDLCNTICHNANETKRF